MATITIPTITSTLTTSFTSYIISTITINKSISGGFISTTIREVTVTSTNTANISTIQNVTDILITVLVTVILSIIAICIQRFKIRKLRRQRDKQITQTQLLTGTGTGQPPTYAYRT
jgi:hypothetical protein